MNTFKRVGIFATLIVAGLSHTNAAWAGPLLMPGKKTLYQRVLTQPGCILVMEPGITSGEEQPAFSRFYVYERQQKGAKEWLKVGPDSFDKSVGWLDGGCTVEWKMQLTLKFTNPANRNPVVFYKEKKDLESLLEQEDPAKQLEPLLAKLDKEGRDPKVVAREPKLAVNQASQFYLLPVLKAEEIYTDRGEARILNVASVSKPEANTKQPTPVDISNTLKGFTAAVVFVIDTTKSMGPYIERTRDAIRKVYERIEQEKLQKQVKFGLIAFRSSTDAVPELEYVSKVYVDPNDVKDGDDFLMKVKELSATKVSSKLFDEDAYAGVWDALNKIDWRDFGARHLILITDAGAIDSDNELSTTKMGAAQLRSYAKDRGVALYAMHLKTDSGQRFENHSSAETQYNELTFNDFLQKPLYNDVQAGDVESFGRQVDQLSDTVTSQVKAAYFGEDAAGSALGASDSYTKAKAPAPTTPQPSLANDAKLLGHAMMLAYLGEKTGASAPPVFNAWITDRDPVKPTQPTTEVNILLTKGQLSDLADTVKQISRAANEGLISPDNMFAQLRSVAAAMGNDPNQLQQNKTTKLADMGLLGEYLEDLPYKSETLNLDEDLWKSMDGLEQEKFIRRLAAKLKYYEKCNQDVDRWVALAPNSDPREHVYPISLDQMP